MNLLSVRPCLQRPGERLGVVAGLVLDVAHDRHGPVARRRAQVDLPRRVRAVRLRGAAQAPPARVGRLAARLEVVEGAEGLDAGGRGLAHPVVDQVHVVAALRHQGEGALGLVPPVAAHEAVGEVPVSDVLGVVDGDHVPDGAALDDLLDLDDWREVSEDVAHGEEHAALLARRGDLAAVGLCHRHRLLHQHVVTQLGERNRGLLFYDVNVMFYSWKTNVSRVTL